MVVAKLVLAVGMVIVTLESCKESEVVMKLGVTLVLTLTVESSKAP